MFLAFLSALLVTIVLIVGGYYFLDDRPNVSRPELVEEAVEETKGMRSVKGVKNVKETLSDQRSGKEDTMSFKMEKNVKHIVCMQSRDKHALLRWEFGDRFESRWMVPW